MKPKPGKIVDIIGLASAYARAGRDLASSGAELERAARMIDAGRLELAEASIRAGLDRLALAMREIPRSRSAPEKLETAVLDTEPQ